VGLWRLSNSGFYVPPAVTSPLSYPSDSSAVLAAVADISSLVPKLKTSTMGKCREEGQGPLLSYAETKTCYQ